MQREQSRYPQDWFAIGDRELRRARNLLNLGDLEGTGFNLQQAVEMDQYYIEQRYPFTVASELTEDEISASLAAAVEIISMIRRQA